MHHKEIVSLASFVPFRVFIIIFNIFKKKFTFINLKTILLKDAVSFKREVES